MTPEKQRIAIAEACGWTGPFKYEWLIENGEEGEDVWAFCATKDGERDSVPNYPLGLDAMHQAEKALTESQWDVYANLLVNLWVKQHAGPIGSFYCHATAAQRAEAFLRTIGKWEET